MSFDQHMRDDARLRILQTLHRQTDGRLGDAMLEHALDAFGHRRSRDWIRTQLRAMAELGAVTIPVDTAAQIVAELTRAGLDHVTRRGVIEGIKRPEPGE